MQTRKSEISQDIKLRQLSHEMGRLSSEEVGFQLGENKINEKGRTMDDITKDMIKVYQKTNDYLAQRYPDEKIATDWIATNKISLKILQEKLSSVS
jgi:hypothetical protein